IGRVALDDRVQRRLPVRGRLLQIRLLEDVGVHVQGGLDLGRLPVRRSVPQSGVLLRAELAERTFSSRCSWVHSGPIVSGVTPAALSLGACSRNSLQVLGGPEMPAFSRTLGLYQSTLDRWMLTGTE